MQAALGDPLQYIGNLPYNFMPPMVGQPPTLDPAVASPLPGMKEADGHVKQLILILRILPMGRA